jgi:hypothetical protein
VSQRSARTECWVGSLFEDYPRGLSVASMGCSQKAGENRSNRVWRIFFRIKIPEHLQNLNVAGRVGTLLQFPSIPLLTPEARDRKSGRFSPAPPLGA